MNANPDYTNNTLFTNGLTPAQEERLELLIEECSEVIQACTKSLRHGYGSSNPFGNEQTTNKADLQKELGQLLNALQMMVSASDVSLPKITEAKHKKQQTIHNWLHFQ